MALSRTALVSAADILMDARRNVTTLEALPEDCRPANLAEGYAIQDDIRARWGDRIAGWKVGATAKAVQEKFGTNEPFAGPFFVRDTVATPGRVSAKRFTHRAIESEFAFRFGKSLPARDSVWTRSSILDAIDAVVPAIELVGPRFKDLLFGRAPTAVADCAVNAGFVLGKPETNWRPLDLVAHIVRLSVDGVVKAEGTGANVLGNPLVVLDWAVEHLRVRGIGIETGQIISTGTTTGIVFLETGQHAVADFGPLGTVAITYE
jgi:2-keto-4-pentenoate hydratase